MYYFIYILMSFIEDDNDKFTTKEIIQERRTDHIKLNFQDMLQIYYFKLDNLKFNQSFNNQVKRIWSILEKTNQNELTRQSYIILFRKIYLYILPSYNRHEIDLFITNEYYFISNGSNKITYEQFTNALFRFIHIWSTHVNIVEYESLLKSIIDHITRKYFIYLDGNVIYPKRNLIVKLYKRVCNREFYRETFEPAYRESPNIYDYYEEEETLYDKSLQRLNVIHYLDLKEDDDFYVYDEEIVYQETLLDSKYL